VATPDNPTPPIPAGLQPEGAPPQESQGGYHPNTEELLKQGHAATAHKLAKWLLVLLSGTVLIHYTCLMFLIFYKRDEGIKVLEEFSHAWLPVLSGLAGSAVTYYFTKNGK
jgi:hypothetical protein